MSGVISAVINLIGTFFKVTMYGIWLSPLIFGIYFFIQIMQPRTYQLSSLEKIANSFITGKPSQISKNKHK